MALQYTPLVCGVSVVCAVNGLERDDPLLSVQRHVSQPNV